MIEILSSLIRDQFFIVHFERFQLDSGMVLLDRFFAKHPLLRPELIVVNDQPYGFRGTRSKLRSLEQCPISCELEYSKENDDYLFQSLNLTCEVPVPVADKFSEIVYLANLFSKTISVDRVKQLMAPHQESIVVSSRLSDAIVDTMFDQEGESVWVTDSDIEELTRSYLKRFVDFIKILDDVLVKGHSLKQMDQLLESI